MAKINWIVNKVDSSTQTDKAYKQLLEAIVSGDIAPGSRLRETDLAKDLGIGRGPLREAIHRLEGLRMVTKAAHVGAQVVELDLTELIEIYQVRENLEGLACEFAAVHMTDDEISKLGRLLDEHAAFLESNDGESYIDQNSDLDFHFQIIQSSRNNWLIRLLCDELYHRVRMYRYQSAQQRSRPHDALEEHQRIFQALKSRDGELASLLMKRHISKARLAVEQRIEQK